MKRAACLAWSVVLVVALAVVVGCNEKPKPPKAPTTEPVQAASPDVGKSPATTGHMAGHEAMTMGESPAAAAPGAPAPAAAGTEIVQKLCPVTGDPIDPKVYIDHNGRRVYFCCSACEPTFKKDPDKYLKIVDDQIKAAATK